MFNGWDLQLTVPLWRGGGTPDVAAGAHRLAGMTTSDSAVENRTVAIADRSTATTVMDGGVADLQDVVDHLTVMSDVLTETAPARVLTFGGDCTVDVASIAHLAATHPDLRLVWIDAHADLNTHVSSPSGHAHGMPLRLLLGEGHPRLIPATTLSPDRCLLVGTRSMDPPEVDVVRAQQIPQLTAPDLRDRPAQLIDLLDSWLPERASVHVHLDLDVLDPETWPAVAVPEPDGLTVDDVVAVIDAVRRRGDLVGATITEYTPNTNHDPDLLRPILRALQIPVTHSHPRPSPVGQEHE